VPSDSEASLTSFGTASLFTSFGMTLRDVFPRRVSAEGPLASLGATKKGARGDKIRKLGAASPTLSCRAIARHPKDAKRQKKRLWSTAGGLAQKTFLIQPQREGRMFQKMFWFVIDEQSLARTYLPLVLKHVEAIKQSLLTNRRKSSHKVYEYRE